MAKTHNSFADCASLHRRLFREARSEAGLPEALVLYCGRHDYGTRILKKTGNLAAVMRTMGHKGREDCNAVSIQSWRLYVLP